MEKIGILTCLNSNRVCTGASCLKAFNDRSHFFAGYLKDTQLGAFMTCNGCAAMQPLAPAKDPGMQEKVQRLRAEGITKVHVGVCRLGKDQKECSRMTEICEMIEDAGITVIRGTHREG